jgi:hypothetical protein
MAIVKETGAIVAGANAYATLAEVDLYHEERLNTAWTNADDEAKEAAMLRATAGMESHTAWPRKEDKEESLDNGYVLADMTKLVDNDGIEIGVDEIPALVVQAYKEICLIEIAEPFVSVRLSRNDMLKYQRVDVIEQEWLRNAPAVTSFPHIDALLSGLASTAPVKLGASIGLTESEQDSIADTAAFDRWFTSLLV